MTSSAALDELRGAPLDRVPPAIRGSVSRLLVHCLLLERACRRGGGGHAAAAGDHRRSRHALLVGDRPLDVGRAPRAARPSAARRSTYPPSPRATSSCAAPSWPSMLASTGRRDEVHRLVEGTPSPDRAARRARRRPRRGGQRAVRHRRPRRGAGGAVDRRRGGRPCRQPDPRPTPATVPAPSPTCSTPTFAAGGTTPTMGPDARADRERRAVGSSISAPVTGRTRRARPRQGLHRLPAAVVGRARHPIARQPPPGRHTAGRVAGEPGPGAGPGRAAPSHRRRRAPSVAPPATCSPTCRRCRRGGSRSRSSVRSSWPSTARPSPRPSCVAARVRTLLALLVVHGTLTRDLAIDAALARPRPRRRRPEPARHADLSPPAPGAGAARRAKPRSISAPTPTPSRCTHRTTSSSTCGSSGGCDATPTSAGNAPTSTARSRCSTPPRSKWRGEPLTDLASVVGQEPRDRACPAAPARQPPGAERAAPRPGPGRERPGRRRTGPRPRPLLGTGPPARHRRRAPHPRPAASRDGDRAGPRHARRARRRARARHPDPAPARHNRIGALIGARGRLLR